MAQTTLHTAVLKAQATLHTPVHSWHNLHCTHLCLRHKTHSCFTGTHYYTRHSGAQGSTYTTHSCAQGTSYTTHSCAQGRKYTTYVCCFNAQSAGHWDKITDIGNFVHDENVDTLFLTDTWLRCQGDEAKCVDTTPVGYNRRSLPRVHTRRRACCPVAGQCPRSRYYHHHFVSVSTHILGTGSAVLNFFFFH